MNVVDCVHEMWRSQTLRARLSVCVVAEHYSSHNSILNWVGSSMNVEVRPCWIASGRIISSHRITCTISQQLLVIIDGAQNRQSTALRDVTSGRVAYDRSWLADDNSSYRVTFADCMLPNNNSDPDPTQSDSNETFLKYSNRARLQPTDRHG